MRLTNDSKRAVLIRVACRRSDVATFSVLAYCGRVCARAHACEESQ